MRVKNLATPPSAISKFHPTVGQQIKYRYALQAQESDGTLYLAVPSQIPMEKYNPLSSAETLEERRQQALHQCDHLIRDFSKRADRHKVRYKRLQIISIVLAISTTILSALSASKVLGQLDWIVLAISGLATLSTTLLSQTNSQKMWVQSRNISQAFQMELFLYLQCAGEYTEMPDESDRLRLFSKRLMETWSQAQESWSQQASSGK